MLCTKVHSKHSITFHFEADKVRIINGDGVDVELARAQQKCLRLYLKNRINEYLIRRNRIEYNRHLSPKVII